MRRILSTLLSIVIALFIALFIADSSLDAKVTKKYKEMPKMYDDGSDEQEADKKPASRKPEKAKRDQKSEAQKEAEKKEADLQKNIEKGKRLANEATQLAKNPQSDKDLKRSISTYEKALKVFEETGFDQGIYQVVYNMGAVQWLVGQHAAALESYDKSLEMARKFNDEKTEAVILNNLGSAHAVMGDLSKAVEAYEKSLDIRRKVGDPRGEGESLNNLGIVYVEWGWYAKAATLYEKAVEISRRIGDSKGEAVALNNLGNLYGMWGQYPKTIEFYGQSLEKKKQLGDIRGEAVTQTNLGTVYGLSGQHSRALEFYEKAFEINKRLGDVRGQADVVLNIGRVYEHKGENDQALKKYKEGLELYRKAGMPIRWPSKLIGDLYLERGEMETAEQFIKDSTDNSSLGKLYLAQSKPLKAEPEFETVLKSAEQSKDADKLFTAYTGLGKVYEALEDYERAQEYYSKGFNMTEEMRSMLMPAERKDFFDVKVNGFYRSEPARGLTRVRMKLNNPNQSIASSEVTRARAFADNISQRSETANSGLPKELREKEEQLLTRIATLKKNRAKTPKEENPERYEKMSSEITQLEKELETFVEVLWDKHKAYAAVKYPRPVKLKDSAIKPEEYVIMYDVVGEGVGVKLIKGKQILSTFYSNWNLNDLERDVLEFRKPFEGFQLRAFNPELANNLYSRLLSAVLSGIPQGSSVTIIPDGILAILPFEALVVRGTPTWTKGDYGEYPEGLTYVGDLYQINYYQSITALTLARDLSKPKGATDKVLVMADPVFGLDDSRLEKMASETKNEWVENLPQQLTLMKVEAGVTFPRLPLTGKLAEKLKSMYPGKTESFTGLEATKSTLMKKDLDQFGLIVFATHGYYGKDLPGIQEPVLALTQLDQSKDGKGGFLTMSEVMNLKLSSDVVALTACQTGLGKQTMGEGVMGMGRAFQSAGAKSVLMSLWSVAESSSVRLVENFFKHVKEGKPKLEALKLARDDVRKAGFVHPFFWAPFVLIGEAI